MNQSSNAGGHMQHGKRRSMRPMLTTAILIIVVIAIVAYLALSWHGVTTVTSSQTLSVMKGQSAYFKLKNSSDLYSLYLKNTSSAYATIYVSKVPVLTTPIVSFELVSGQSANISADGSSQNADLEVELISGNATGARIGLIPIPSIFAIKTSAGVQITRPASFYTINNATSPPVTPTPTNTTKNTTKTTTNSTSTPPPPPPKPTTTPLQNISTVLNATYIGALMKNYKALYIQDTACTSQAYGTALQVYANQAPIGPSDFTNASERTPTNLIVNASQSGASSYFVTYTVATPNNGFPKPSVTFNFSSTSGVVTNIVFTGIYLDLNYTSLENAYNFQKGIGGSCGAYIPYIP
jgi:hypothetical protein